MKPPIEIINNKARHNLINTKCRWRSDRLDGAGSFRELLNQTKVMQICQRETQNHQGVITHEICCLAAQLFLCQFSLARENLRELRDFFFTKSEPKSLTLSSGSRLSLEFLLFRKYRLASPILSAKF